MKTNLSASRYVCVFLLSFLSFLHFNTLATSNPKIDPIRFTLTTDAQHILPNEEFEIKITAKYLTINPNLVYVFAGSNNFRLKLVVPDGFKQTGGTYHDYIGTELTTAKPTITYTVRGKFSETDKGGDFQLLRSHKDANSESEFIQVGKLSFTVISPIASKDSVGSQARLAVLTPKYVPYMTQAELRAGLIDTTSTAVYITEGLRSGMFRFDPANNTSADDSAMVLRYGSKRYIREDIGYIRPEWWGAKRDGTTDDYVAFQKMLNSVKKATKVSLSPGTYVINKTLKPKVIKGAPQYSYDLTIEGAGDWTTVLLCQSLTDIDAVIEFREGRVDFNGRSNNITIRGLRIDAAGKANNAIHFEYIAGLDMSNCTLNGGIVSNLVIDGETDNYGISIRNVYSGGWGKNGHNTNNFYLRRVRYALLDRITTDGSRYGMNLDQCDKNFISNCHLEGNKEVSLWLNGGGENKVSDNFMLPYSGYEPNALFRGQQHSIKVNSVSGSANNIITGNVLATYSNKNNIPTTLISATTPLVASPDTLYKITGQTYGGTGLLIGFNRTNNNAVIQVITGSFMTGETILQSTSGGTASLGAFLSTKSVGIGLYDAPGYNTITGNQIRGTQEYAIWNASDLNVITGNSLEATGDALYNASNRVMLTGNIIYAPTAGAKAINSVNGTVYATNNYISAGGTAGNITKELASNADSQRIPKINTDGSLVNSPMSISGTSVGINTTPSSGVLHTMGGGSQAITMETPGNFAIGLRFKRPNKEYLAGINVYNNGTDEWAIYDKTAEQFRMIVFGDGNVKLGHDVTANSGEKLQVVGDAKSTGTQTAAKFKLSALNTAPASATATGTAGEIRVTATYIYVCTATNTWVRSALTTW
jgi:hypothetical protein